MNTKTTFSRKLKRQSENILIFLSHMQNRLSKRTKLILKNIVKGLLIAFFMIPIATSIIQYDRMPSNSMNNTIKKDEGIFTLKTYYGITIYPFVSKFTGKTFVFNKPKRGDIVLITNPEIKNSAIKNFFSYVLFYITLGTFNQNNTDRYLVKRIIALPGETIEIKNKDIYINGVLINETWNKTHLDKRILDSYTANRDNYGPFVVPYNEYFTLSDSRDYAYDGRNYGSTPFNLIKGKVLVKEKT